MSFESKVEKFRSLAGQAGAETNEAILIAAKAQGYTGSSVNGALRHLALQAGGGSETDINDAMHSAAVSAGRSNWADTDGDSLSFAVDWSGYDGSKNSTPVDLIPSYQRSGECVAIDGTKVLVVQGEGPTGDVDIVSRIITRSGTDLSLGSPVVLQAGLTSGIYGLAKVIRLSDTRYLSMGTVSAEGNALKFFLLDETGAKLDEASLSGVNSYSYGDLTRHSDTVAVCAYSDQNVSKNGFLVAVSVSGDTISFGTAVQFHTLVSGNMRCESLTASVGHAVHRNRVYRYTLSGTTVTVGNTSLLDPAKGQSANDGAKELRRIDDTHSLVIMEWDSDSTTPYALVITDGTTPSPGTGIQLDTVKPALWDFSGGAVTEDNTAFLFCWRRNVLSPFDKAAQSAVVIVDPENDYALSTPGSVQISGDVFADHPVCASFGSSGYAVSFWQDEDDNQAMGTVLITA